MQYMHLLDIRFNFLLHVLRQYHAFIKSDWPYLFISVLYA